jgi:NodT family efflux transporter outer membrane factor (OMF) lipoprotein
MLAAGLSILLAACTTVRVDLPSQPAVPDHFQSVPEVGASNAGTAASSPSSTAQWWHTLPDPTLSALIDRGLQANTDIRMAIARVRESRAVVSQAESALYPTLAAYGAIGRAQTQNAHLTDVPALPLPVATSTAVDLPVSSFNGSGFAAAWEVDIFGARRSDAEAARQAALAYEERWHGAQMMVAGDIASNYIEARSLERRQAVLAQSIATAQRLQRYAEGRFDAGQASRSDVERAQAQVAALQSMTSPLQSLLATRLRRLAVLTGQAPEAITRLPAPTPEAPADASVIPAQLPSVLPSDVLERRPDVRGAANQVRALAARVGSAKADLFPRFYLGFLSNDGHLRVGDLPGASSSFYTWGAGVHLPIFEGGRIRARIQASNAQLEAAGAQYEQAVNTALEDVENAYNARWALDQRAAALTTAWQAAHDADTHAERLFEEGATLLQPALEARLQGLQRQDDLIQAQTARALTTVLLYKAIGGGWQAQPLPAPADTAAQK